MQKQQLNRPPILKKNKTKTSFFVKNELINSYSEKDIVKFRRLIKNSSDINCLDSSNRSLISMVVNDISMGWSFDESEIFFEELLLQGVNLERVGIEQGLLSIAITGEANNTYLVKKLLDHNISVNSFGVMSGMLKYPPPIFSAIQKNDMEIINLLLEKHPDLELYDHYGFTVLSFLLSEFNYGDKENNNLISIFKLLIDFGADPNQREYKGNQIVHSLCYCKNITNEYQEIMDILLDFGVDINSKNEDGHTPLMLSVIQNNYAACDLFIRNGADKDIKSPLKTTAADISSNSKDSKIRSLFKI